MTVPGTAARHPGHHRAIYSKTVAGNLSFFDGLWVAFGTLGRPNASATLFGRTFLGTIFGPKVGKEASKKASQKIYRKNLEKITKRLPK